MSARPSLGLFTSPTEVWQQRELRDLLEKSGSRVTYEELDAPYGHDTFLIEHRRLGAILGRFLA